jgi:hypothetical protein
MDHEAARKWQDERDARLRQQYRDAGWGKLAECVGLDPLNTESQCRYALRTIWERLVAPCDRKEQYAFEAWAKSEDYDMHEHPLHYLFLDEKTNAARQGWNAAIRYMREAMGVVK